MSFNRYKKGFGLLEVAISGTIITIIMASLVVLGRSSLNSTEAAKERSTATYLAQDAIEKVRQMRDTNWIDGLSGTGWDSLCWETGTHIIKCSEYGSASAYHIDYIVSPELRYLLRSGTSSAETHDGIAYQTQIKLFRPNSPDPHLLSILPLDGDANNVDPVNNGLVVEAQVTWPGQGGSADRNVTVRELLTNWRPNY